MTTPAELAVHHTDLDEHELAHLQRLQGSWGVLADLSFSDLLLLATVERSGGSHLVVIGQMRPTTNSTLMSADLVGHMLAAEDWPMAATALASGAVTTGTAPVPEPLALRTPLSNSDPAETGEVPAVPEDARFECVPVSHGGRTVALLVSVSALESRRRTGRLERIYRDLYSRLAAMVASGVYPFEGDDVSGEDTPRVGDGLVVIGSQGRITYASPNAMNALHRMGVSAAVEGRTLNELGVEETAVDRSLASGRPVIEEVERRPDVIALVHCTPLLADGAVTGVMVLLRDVTDLRRLDRLLLSKDAAIREVHHRVKNNLQTIYSLLSLQARRLDPGEAQDALHEAGRRVRSIAVVHEVLSREPGDQVPFAEIVDALIRMARDSVVSAHQVQISVTGDLGDLAAETATPLSLVLAELLQNAVEHAFEAAAAAEPGEIVGHVDLVLTREGDRLHVEVRDDGSGLPDDFDIERTRSLGLSIVRDLVTSQLGGRIAMESRSGTLVALDVPVHLDDR